MSFLYNSVDGSYFWYHVSRQKSCVFEKGKGFHSGVAFFMPTLEEILKFTNTFTETERENDTVTVCKVQIKDGKIFNSSNDLLSYEAMDDELGTSEILQDPQRNLTPLGLKLVNYLGRYARRSDDLTVMLYNLLTMYWQSFDPEGRHIYLSKFVYRFLKRNGFRGWLETEQPEADGYNANLYEEEINLALIYPEEDVIVIESTEINIYEQDF